MEEQLLVDAFAPHDVWVPEQVIEVPKILIDELPARTSVREAAAGGTAGGSTYDRILVFAAADYEAERRHSSS